MKALINKTALAIAAILMFSACSSTQSLQEYYVDNSENPNFISVDIPASILNIAIDELSAPEKKAVESIRKLNILAFRKTGNNIVEFKAEKAKVSAILSDKKYNSLMKINSKLAKGTVKYLGDDDAIDEVVIYGNSDKDGFAVIRVLGDNMNPANLGLLIKAMEKSNFNGEGLGELGNLIK